MSRTNRVKATGEGKMRYHLTSRTVNRQFLLRKAAAKDKLMEIAMKSAEFSGVELEVVTVMDNHFHIVCLVSREREPVPAGEVLRRIGVLKGEKAASELSERWSGLEAAGFVATREAEIDAWRARMGDVSAYMKTFKELFAIWFNREYGYSGSVWSGVFKSTMIEDGRYFEQCRRYVMLNPVRAGIVSQVKDYRWVWCAKRAENAGNSAGTAVFPGCLPMSRVAQVGSGKILGSEAFVTEWIARLGDRFRARRVVARRAGELGYSSHGWRLARRDAKARGASTGAAQCACGGR